jgi:hypothetical protein
MNNKKIENTKNQSSVLRDIFLMKMKIKTVENQSEANEIINNLRKLKKTLAYYLFTVR